MIMIATANDNPALKPTEISAVYTNTYELYGKME